MEKLNIAELLRECPTGMELDCTICDNVYFDEVTPHVIKCFVKNDVYNPIYFHHDGTYFPGQSAKCVIFPKGKTTWEGFLRPFKDGDVVATLYGRQIFIFKENAVNVDGEFNGVCYFGFGLQDDQLFKKGTWSFSRHATSEEKQKLFDAIKANGYKWNAETKTLEKLEKEKFDITSLKPFESRVLVRDNVYSLWQPSVWGLYDKEHRFPYITIGKRYKLCIPYEGNQHLLGTTNDCDDYYKTW